MRELKSKSRTLKLCVDGHKLHSIQKTDTDVSEDSNRVSWRDFVYCHSKILFVEYSNGFFPGDTEGTGIDTTITGHVRQRLLDDPQLKLTIHIPANPARPFGRATPSTAQPQFSYFAVSNPLNPYASQISST